MAGEKSQSSLTSDSECVLGTEEKKSYTADARKEAEPEQSYTADAGKEAKPEQSTADSAKQVVPEKEILPLRLYTPHGQRLHKQMCIEYNLTNRRCETCGETGQLTCFVPGFRNWALRRATPEELNQKCNRCGELGHNCLECDIPITYNWAPSSKRRCDLRRTTGRDRQRSPKGV